MILIDYVKYGRWQQTIKIVYRIHKSGFFQAKHYDHPSFDLTNFELLV